VVGFLLRKKFFDLRFSGLQVGNSAFDGGWGASEERYLNDKIINIDDMVSWVPNCTRANYVIIGYVTGALSNFGRAARARFRGFR
jgi:hypothetical protein